MPGINLSLEQDGPIVTAWIFPSPQRLDVYQKAGMEPPRAQSGRFLLDSGASSTCVDMRLIKELGLNPISRTQIHTPSTDGIPEYRDIFDIQIMIEHNFHQTLTPQSGILSPMFPHHQALPIIGTSMAEQSIDGLIGRDILKLCHFTINGHTNSFSLWW